MNTFFSQKNKIKIRSALMYTALAGTLISPTLSLAKDYQVTGLVTEVSDSKIIVDKKGEKFEMTRQAHSKISSQPGQELKVGSKVTVYYSMTASEIEVKDDKKPASKK